MHAKQVAVVTGANRGLGRETVRQLARKGYTVVATSRERAKADAVASELSRELGDGAEIVPFVLDVTSEEDARALAAFLSGHFGRLDVLVNNAATIFDDTDAPALSATPEVLRRSLQNNVESAFLVLRALADLLTEGQGANVVNVSSGMGALHDMEGGYLGYRLSKTALNALTRIAHTELSPKGVRVNSVCPGWVRTEMGGASAERDVAEGAAGIVWAATLGPGGPSGGFFRDGKPIDW